MSRWYRTKVTVTNPKAAHLSALADALYNEWGFSEKLESAREDENGSHIELEGESTLCAGEGEEELAGRLAKAAWTANGEYCKVLVTTTFLDDLPYEIFSMEEDDYAEIMGGEPKAPLEVRPMNDFALFAESMRRKARAPTLMQRIIRFLKRGAM